MSTTDKGRWFFRILLATVVVVALAGWWFYDADPADLSAVIGWIVTLNVAGEGANIGKRFTFKKEAVDVEVNAR